ncbi:hypothetical protein [Dankookia sp. GCM10030260]|uniref:hypothetical protein n=1 Tax=Dankookia sp. GCM10030260 TaxID=3273390 RepID=UPI0036D3CCC9
MANIALSQAAPPLLGATILLAALALLPAPALFLAGVIGAIGLGLSLAELRRHGGPDVPSLPPMTER